MKILIQTTRGLSNAHHGYKSQLHMDVKPSNLLITLDGFTKLSDFGSTIPRAIKEKYYGPQEHGEVGTYPYMAPELWEGKNSTSKCDMYSLGCTLYELITLHRTYEYFGDHDSHRLKNQVL